MNITMSAWIILQILIGYNLLVPFVLYVFWFSKKGSNKNIKQPIPYRADYAIIVTAYEQTHSLESVISSILQLNYSNFMVYIVADNCDISNLHFNDSRVIILRPPNTLASNIKSHFYAIKRFVREHDRLTIIDSDNLVHPEYLTELNLVFDTGYQAVQGLRVAKNLDTSLSCLDAARDIYYHFYDGKVLFEIGSSATLSGSGMAFTVNLYRECLEHVYVPGAGFDKILQAAIVGKNLRIAFSNNAVVYDEKTSRSEQLVQQRSRWINTWFKYFSLGFKLLGKGIKNKSFNQLMFGLIILRPPLFLFIILSVVCFFINVWLSPVTAIIWLVALLIFILGFYIALESFSADRLIYKSLKNIPRFMFYQVISLLRLRRKDKISVATKHYHPHSIDHLKDTK